MGSGPCSQKSPLHIVRVSTLALGERHRDLNDERRQQHPTEEAPVTCRRPIDDEREHDCEGCAQKQDIHERT